MSRPAGLGTRLPLVVVDGALFAIAWTLAFGARLELIEPEDLRTILTTIPFVVLGKILVFRWFGAHRSMWRYSSVHEIENLVRGTVASALLVVVFFRLDSAQAIAQMAAEDLGVGLDAIEMVMGDTDRCPWDMGTFGSLSTRMFGPAATRS